jgi:hypothetical protein
MAVVAIGQFQKFGNLSKHLLLGAARQNRDRKGAMPLEYTAEAMKRPAKSTQNTSLL